MTKFLNISTDTTLGGNAPSDEIVASQKAIKTAVDTKVSKTGDSMTNDLEMVDGCLYLEGIGSTVSLSTSRLVLGTPNNKYAYLTGNSQGVFGIYSEKSGSRKGIACYPDQNFFADTTTKTIDLGRSNNVWKTCYVDTVSDGTKSITVANIVAKQDALVSGTNIKTVNGTSVLGSGDISTTELPSQSGQSGKFLTTNGTTVSWATVGGGGSSTLAGLSDVTLTSPSNGQVLTYDNGDWVNADPTGGYHPDLFDWKWADHQLDDVQWLRADTFSWQSGSVYQAAYDHLFNEYDDIPREPLQYIFTLSGEQYYRFPAADHSGESHPYAYASINSYPVVIVYANSTSVSTSTIIYDGFGSSATNIGSPSSVAQLSYKMPIIEAIAGTNIAYFQASDGHKIVLANQESAVTAIYAATGVAWYYVLDTVNQRFKLPRTKFGVTGLRDTVGKYVEAGAPNIVGSSYGYVTSASRGASGALKMSGGSGKDATGGGGWWVEGVSVGVDASESSSVYGNSDTVQPKATQMYLYFYVGSFTQTALENTAGITAETLNDKVDIGHQVIAFQEPTSSNNYTWYRKYADGWVEQGGFIARDTAETNTVVFSVPMADTNYSVSVTGDWTGKLTYSPAANKASATTTGISLTKDGSGMGLWWQVSGMAA